MACYLAAATLVNLENTWELSERSPGFGNFRRTFDLASRMAPDRSRQGKRGKVIIVQSNPDRNGAKTKPANRLQPFCDPHCKAYDTGVEHCGPSHVTSGNWARIVIPCD